ncbi:MAG TPA: hypothetical protein PKZ39_05100 [Clostridia bacterium]|nr:hypothetical protein [Clostridia bacterium]
MAKYNTFLVCDCAKRTVLLATSSARKANTALRKGRRVEVWNENERTAIVYSHQAHKMKPYIEVEREYIRTKQMSAEVRNAKRGIMRM